MTAKNDGIGIPKQEGCDTLQTSEKLKAFIDFVDESVNLCGQSYENMKKEENRTQDLLHAIEFETNGRERSKICTKLHHCRNERRRNKDIVEVTEEIAKFFAEPQHKKTLDQMRQLLGKVRKVEKYHRERTYIPKVRD